jgi:hypothetical protein
VDGKYAALLEEALNKLTQEGSPAVPLSSFYLKRTTVHPDSPEDALVGQLHDLLVSRSPKHAAQTRPLVQSLFANISPKGRHTGLCQDFAELRHKRGFSKTDLNAALADLELVPDVDSIRAGWLSRLTAEGFGLIEDSKLMVSLSHLDRGRLSGTSSDEQPLQVAVSEWVKAHPPENSVLQFMTAGEKQLRSLFPGVSRSRLHALIFMEGINVWVVEAFEG